MIDVENEVFTLTATALRAKFNPISIYGEYVDIPAELPCAIVVQQDNSMYELTQDSASVENSVRVMFEARAYSNKAGVKKSECKAILAVIDDVFSQLGFTRTMMSLVPNLADASVCQMISRYTAIVSKNKTIYRR